MDSFTSNLCCICIFGRVSAFDEVPKFFEYGTLISCRGRRGQLASHESREYSQEPLQKCVVQPAENKSVGGRPDDDGNLADTEDGRATAGRPRHLPSPTRTSRRGKYQFCSFISKLFSLQHSFRNLWYLFFLGQTADKRTMSEAARYIFYLAQIYFIASSDSSKFTDRFRE